ncbi:MAG TPA: M23 family metallopeptidase [Planctomycetaceae bacterium]|nr:M23 family metallopeptidase [Planctomycetaceae bacterium]
MKATCDAPRFIAAVLVIALGLAGAVPAASAEPVTGHDRGASVDEPGVAGSDQPGLDGGGAGAAGEMAAAVPERYTLDYPAADRFCPPVRSAFHDAARTLSTVGRRTFRHPANGNYGFVQKVQGHTLVHVGADLALLRVGEPVFAVADGVVRVSSGPAPPDKSRKAAKPLDPAGDAQPPKKPAIVAPWGNMIAIEHRLADGEFVTTIYGHLDTDRLVKAGDIVRAGQQIGEVGRQHPLVNGGYKPHLHFGVKEGRLAEIGRGLLPLNLGAGPAIARIAAVTEDELELDPGQPLPEGAGDFRLKIGGVPQEFRRNGDRYVAPARILWLIPSTPEFPLAGHTSSSEGFYDPIAFLRRQQADSRPARFVLGPPAKK